MNLLEQMREQAQYMVSIRRRIHENPELSGQEKQTLELIGRELAALGIKTVTVPDGGILGILEGCAPGRTLLLRADVDALPIEESPVNLAGGKACVSRVPGVSHACGHDAHVAMLLGAARFLHARREQLRGRVVLCFEQGEETAGCYGNLLRYLEREAPCKVDGCYATHVRWDIDCGKVSVAPGAVMAGGFGFEVKLIGKGGHGSRPDLAASPIDCFTGFHSALAMLRQRVLPPRDTLSCSIGTVHAGNLANIIPEELIFSGTTRFFELERVGEPFVEWLRRTLASVTQAHGCRYELLRWREPFYEVYNDEVCAAIAQSAVTTGLGGDVLVPCEPWMASESMSAYLQLYPGVLSFTGIRNSTLGSGANHHTAEFDLDEESLRYGAAACAAYTLKFLAYNGELPSRRNNEPVDRLTARGI